MVTRMRFNTRSAEDYRKFLAVRRLPSYRFVGNAAEVSDEYAATLGESAPRAKRVRKYEPVAGMFDYQQDITAIAIKKQKYAIFADCGLGKTLMLLEFARHAALVSRGGRVLIVCPLMVVSHNNGQHAEANARLMAAAPDLLHFAKQVVKFAADHSNFYLMAWAQDVVNKVEGNP